MPLDLLVVEDNPADLRLLEEAFREAGVVARVSAAADGLQALELVRARADDPHDAVVLDLNLPRMDGRQFLRALGEDRSLPSPRVIVLSSSTAPRDVEQTTGVLDYIAKPVRFDDFLNVVRRIVSLCRPA